MVTSPLLPRPQPRGMANVVNDDVIVIDGIENEIWEALYGRRAYASHFGQLGGMWKLLKTARDGRKGVEKRRAGDDIVFANLSGNLVDIAQRVPRIAEAHLR